MTTFHENLLRGVRDIPGITAAGLTSAIPFRGFDSRAKIRMPDGERQEIVRVRYVDGGFFAALRVPVVRGRLFSSEDREGSAAVTVISASLARSAFGDADPVGKIMRLPGPIEVVGVVGDLRYDGLDKDPISTVYLPGPQFPRPMQSLLVRIPPSVAQRGAIESIRRVVHDLDPGLPVLGVATVDQVVNATIAGRRFYTVATGAFGFVALTLTTVGLVLVVARTVAERRRELAVRAALGATATRLAQAALGDAIIAIVAGVCLGLLFAGIGSVLMKQFLFQIAERSPLAYAGAAMLVICVAGAAAWLPMRRFERLSLAEMLRQD